MFKRRYIFGMISIAMSAAALSACSNGGSSNNNNPCANGAYNNNPAYYNNNNNGYNANPGYNPGYNPSLYNNGGCTGYQNRPNILNGANNTNNNVAQTVQQAQLREAVAEADATQLSEQLRREKNARRRRGSDTSDDSSSDSNSNSNSGSGSSNDSVTLIPGPTTVRIVGGSSSTSVAAAPVAQASAPVAQQPAALPAQQPQNNGYVGTQTPVASGSVINQPVVPSAQPQTPPPPSQAATTYPAPPPATATQASGDVNTPVDAGQPSSSVSYGNSGPVPAPIAVAPPPASVPQILAPTANNPLPVTVISEGTLRANTSDTTVSAFEKLISYMDVKNAKAANWTDSGAYEDDLTDAISRKIIVPGLSASTALQLPAATEGKKKYTYYIERTGYVPTTDHLTDLWALTNTRRLCDIEVAQMDACIVLERDKRDGAVGGGLVVDRAYILLSMRPNRSLPASASNYIVLRAEFPNDLSAADTSASLKADPKKKGSKAATKPAINPDVQAVKDSVRKLLDAYAGDRQATILITPQAVQ